MTANRRIRKNKNKRSTTDVDPYSLRYRAASDGAKAARAAARSRAEGAGGEAGQVAEDGRGQEAPANGGEERVEPQEVHIVDKFRIREVSLVREGTGAPGYILEVGGVPTERGLQELGLQDFYEGVTLVEADSLFPDVRPQSAEEWRSWQEAVRAKAASDAATVGQRGSEGAPGLDAAGPTPSAVLEGILEARDAAREAYRRQHQVFFEAEVNTIPTHVGTQLCHCEIGANHWVELGEI